MEKAMDIREERGIVRVPFLPFLKVLWYSIMNITSHDLRC